MCYRMLQGIAGYCKVLPGVAGSCRVLQGVARCCSESVQVCCICYFENGLQGHQQRTLNIHKRALYIRQKTSTSQIRAQYLYKTAPIYGKRALVIRKRALYLKQEPSIPIQQPRSVAKESCIFTRGPWISTHPQKSPCNPQKSPCNPQKSPMSQATAQYPQKRTLIHGKRALYLYNRALILYTRARGGKMKVPTSVSQQVWVCTKSLCGCQLQIFF